MVKQMKYIAFYKPYGVISQFTDPDGTRTLAEFKLPKEVYAAGRLDKDSEGLLLLTDDGGFIKEILEPQSNKEKTYWVQVENIPSQEKLKKLERGIMIQGRKTLPCRVRLLPCPKLTARNPPIRERKNIPTAWLEIKMIEGKNRQVRRMTAAINHPTLRLVRFAIGQLCLTGLKPGQWREVAKKCIL